MLGPKVLLVFAPLLFLVTAESNEIGPFHRPRQRPYPVRTVPYRRNPFTSIEAEVQNVPADRISDSRHSDKPVEVSRGTSRHVIIHSSGSHGVPADHVSDSKHGNESVEILRGAQPQTSPHVPEHSVGVENRPADHDGDSKHSDELLEILREAQPQTPHHRYSSGVHNIPADYVSDSKHSEKSVEILRGAQPQTLRHVLVHSSGDQNIPADHVSDSKHSDESVEVLRGAQPQTVRHVLVHSSGVQNIPADHVSDSKHSDGSVEILRGAQPQTLRHVLVHSSGDQNIPADHVSDSKHSDESVEVLRGAQPQTLRHVLVHSSGDQNIPADHVSDSKHSDESVEVVRGAQPQTLRHVLVHSSGDQNIPADNVSDSKHSDESTDILRAPQPNIPQHIQKPLSKDKMVSKNPNNKVKNQEKSSESEIPYIVYADHIRTDADFNYPASINQKYSTNSSRETVIVTQPYSYSMHLDESHQGHDPYHRNGPSPQIGSLVRDFTCPQQNGYFKYTDQCDEYVECKHYVPRAYTCPDGLLFNPQAQWTDYPCEDPSKVQCDNKLPAKRTGNGVTTPRPNGQQPGYSCPQPHGYFRLSDQCDQYIECKNYVAIVFACPSGLHFNPLVKWTEYPCDHPSKVQCEESGNDQTRNPIPPPIPSTPSPNQEPTVRPPPPPTTQPPPQTTRRPLPPSTTTQSPPTTWQPPPPPTFERPTSPPQIKPPPPASKQPLPPPSNNWRPAPQVPVTRPPPIIRQPPPPATTSSPPPNNWRPAPQVPVTRPPPVIRHPPPPATTSSPPPSPPPNNWRPAPQVPVTRPPPIIRQPPPPATTSSPPPSPPPNNWRPAPQVPVTRPPPIIRQPPPPATTSSPPSSPPPNNWRPAPQVPVTRPPPTIRQPPPPATTSSPPPSPTTTQPPPTTAAPATKPKPLPDYALCPQPHGYIKIGDQCDQYIECKNHVPLVLKCPAGLHFNPLADWTEYPCEHPSKVQCNGTSVIATTSTPPKATSPRPINQLPGFKCPESHGYFDHFDKCDQYVECKNHIPLVFACPVGLFFNPFASWTQYPCEHPSNVTCNKESPTEPKEAPQLALEISLPEEKTPAIDIRFPAIISPRAVSPAAVTSRPISETPRPVVKTVRYSREFSPVVARTPQTIPALPTVATSRPSVKTPQSIYIPAPPTLVTSRPIVVSEPYNTSVPSIASWERAPRHLYEFYCEELNAYYAVASDCDAYVECENGVAVHRFCPIGLYFNQKIQWPGTPCDYPSNVQCITGKPINHDLDVPVTLRPNLWAPPSTSRPTRQAGEAPRPVKAWSRRLNSWSHHDPITSRPTRQTFEVPRPVDMRSQRSNPLIRKPDIATTRPTRQSVEAPRPIDVRSQRPNTATQRPDAWSSTPDVSTPRPTRETLEALRPNTWPQRPNVRPTQPNIVTSRPSRDPQYSIVTEAVVTSKPLFITSRTQPTLPVAGLDQTTIQMFDYTCPASNGTYAIPSQCDDYVECKNYTAYRRTCPDGLHFNPKASWPEYPCAYPSEVKCENGDIVQTAKSTADCPRLNGFFRTDSGDCGEYKVCHAGVAVIEHCPPGLVFNFDKDVCDWPISVPGCTQSRELKDFVCPVRPIGDDAQIFKYRHNRSCQNFVACQNGYPRLLSCDAGLRFDEKTEKCVDSSLVGDCEA